MLCSVSLMGFSGGLCVVFRSSKLCLRPGVSVFVFRSSVVCLGPRGSGVCQAPSCVEVGAKGGLFVI